MTKRTKIILIILVLLLAGGWYVGSKVFTAQGKFDPELVARAECSMWQAYYGEVKPKLAYDLVMLARQQYLLSLAQAKPVAEKLAEAAMKFKALNDNYEVIVTPDLVEAYTIINDSSPMNFDPQAAAEAELAWWVARRKRGQDSPENVGEKIAELYAIIYGGTVDQYRESGVLRARAGALRDSGGAQADWEQVESILLQSYQSLAEQLPPEMKTE